MRSAIGVAALEAAPELLEFALGPGALAVQAGIVAWDVFKVR